MSFCFNFLDLKILAIFTTIILICSLKNNKLDNKIKYENSNFTNEIITNSNTENINNLCGENIIIANEIWKLEIPKISLEADISEGTSSEILNKYIGHFEETPKQNGNVALAAHNRGYKVNYFENLKELEIGDIVFYTYKGLKKKYVINSKNIIKDTHWENLKNTKDNRLTLITCVENQPEYRRCIQAIELNEEGRIE